jgi:DNA-binding transcriptional LysR family regulator
MIFAQSEEIMDLLGALGALVRVAEIGSFSAVARERQVSQSAVTRQIVQLEQHFGVRLLHRTTRRLSLTDDGEMLLGHARALLDTVEGMEAALGRQSSSPTGLVRVGVTMVGARFLAPRIPLLLARHPGLKVELVVHDRFGDMVEERLDLALRVGELTDSSLRMRLVRMVSLAVVCGAPLSGAARRSCNPGGFGQSRLPDPRDRTRFGFVALRPCRQDIERARVGRVHRQQQLSGPAGGTRRTRDRHVARTAGGR